MQIRWCGLGFNHFSGALPTTTVVPTCVFGLEPLVGTSCSRLPQPKPGCLVLQNANVHLVTPRGPCKGTFRETVMLYILSGKQKSLLVFEKEARSTRNNQARADEYVNTVAVYLAKQSDEYFIVPLLLRI